MYPQALGVGGWVLYGCSNGIFTEFKKKSLQNCVLFLPTVVLFNFTDLLLMRMINL